MHIYEVHLLKGIYRDYQCHSTPKDDVTQCPYLDWHPSKIRIFHSAVSDWEQGSPPGKWCEDLTLEKEIRKYRLFSICIIVNFDKEIIEMVEFYSDGTINNSTWRFKMFKKRMGKPEFYRLQNQQANPTQQQMPTPIIRRITCERKNWRPIFHPKIRMWVTTFSYFS